MNEEKFKGRKLIGNKGITLVALIITIVVLLILAMAAIGAIRDSKIITHAQNAGSSYTIAQEKEQIGLAVSEWQLQKVIPGNTKTFKEVIGDALQGQIEPIVENTDGSLTVTFNKTGNSYIVDENANITEQEDEIIGGAVEPVTGDFEITVEQTQSDSLANSVTLTIRPIIPDSWNKIEFTEEEAVKIVNEDTLQIPNLTSLEDFDKELYNFINDMPGTPISGEPDVDDYNELKTVILSKITLGEDHKNEIFSYLMSLAKLNYSSIYEAAADRRKEYEPKTYSYKICRNGGEWIDITDKYDWKNKWYQVNDNGNYEIEIQLDDKIARKQVEVKDISYLGRYVKYDSNGDGSIKDETILWRVLRNDNDKVELITADAVGKVDLTPSSFEEARNNYNNLIDILVEECKRVTGITENIRNIYDDEIDRITMVDTIKFSEFTTYKPYGNPNFEDYEGEKGFKKDDEGQFLQSEDWEQKSKVLNGDQDVSESYWYSDRNSQETLLEVGFVIWYHHVYENGGQGTRGIKIAYFDEFGDPKYSISQDESYSNGVRPILTLEPGVLENVKQSGTKDDPIEIYQNK